MNKLVSFLVVVLIVLSQSNLFGQWTINGNDIYNTNTGNVGIGTQNPQAKLHLELPDANSILQIWKRGDNSKTWSVNLAGGDWRLWETTGESILLGVNSSDVSSNNNVGIGIPGVDVLARLHVRGATNDNTTWALRVENSSGTRLFNVRDDGSVGIGTTNPGDYKLAVTGSVHAYEVVVETNWSDFVFEKDYKLMPINELETYVNQNKHLPEIPSADEVKTNGVNLGDTQSKLLQKIEELTLYVIEQNKLIKQQNKRIEKLENKNKRLMKK